MTQEMSLEQVRKDATDHAIDFLAIRSKTKQLIEDLRKLHTASHQTYVKAVEVCPLHFVRPVEDLDDAVNMESAISDLEKIVLDVSVAADMLIKYVTPDVYPMDGDAFREHMVQLEDGGVDSLRVTQDGHIAFHTEEKAGVFYPLGILRPEVLERLKIVRPLMRTSYVREDMFFTSPQDCVLTLRAVQELVDNVPFDYRLVLQHQYHGPYVDISLVDVATVEDIEPAEPEFGDDEFDDDEDYTVSMRITDGGFPVGCIHQSEVDAILAPIDVVLNGPHEVKLLNWKVPVNKKPK